MRSRPFASTARGVALVRALEMTRPAAERVASDPYAASFTQPLSVLGMRTMVATGLSNLMGIEAMMNFAIARERHIGDIMQREAAGDARQIVILGAGFDTRAYRLPVDGLPVFEVDHPVTQAQKRQALRGVVDPLPANVVFVPVDFDRDDLGQQLALAGYDAHKRTLFVWQGVTMYLTPQGIDHTLAFIAGHAAPGSLVVFDFMDSAALEGGAMASLKFFTRALGEAMTFGIDAAQIGPFLERRGFTGVECIEGPMLARLYFTGSNAERPMATGVGIVSAVVR